MRILIADDERTSRLILRKFLDEMGHLVEEADDGLTALRQLRDQADDIDLLILDIMMPEMDGLTLLEIIRRRYPLLPVIMLTAKGDRSFVKRALKLGASDFLDKPITRKDLQSAIREAIGNVSQKTLSDSLQTSQAVREVQSQLLEHAACDKCEQMNYIDFWFRPFSDAGGDFFLCRKGGRFCQVLLADVAGHDVKSSYAVAELRGVLQGLGAHFEEPAELLDAVNRVFATRSGAVEKFICALCVFADFKSGEWRIANAGVPYPYICRADGASHWLEISGNMLGVLDEPQFETAVLQMHEGDKLLAFSDGLEEVLSHERIVAGWRKCAADALRPAMDSFVQAEKLDKAKLKDDILLLGMEQPSIKTRDAEPAELRIEFETTGRESDMNRAVATLTSLADAYFQTDLNYLTQALTALLDNAVKHGNGGRPRLPIKISTTIKRDSNSIGFAVADQGGGFDLDRAIAASPEGSLAKLNADTKSLTVHENKVVVRFSPVPAG